MTCPACSAAITRWYDSKPSEVLPNGASFAFGSGAAYDLTPAGIRDRSAVRYEAWRTLVRDNKTAIKAACAAGNHVTTEVPNA